MKHFFRVKSTLALALLVHQAAVADTYKLEDSVVTATGMAVSAMQSPASITRISAEQIERSSAADVAELFRDVPGVTLVDSDTPGIKRVSIRGESSRRVTVMIDGQTMTDHSNYGTPLLIDPALIERVEVVRGPSSVINGSNAIGGVVNIITKRGGGEPLQGYASGGYYSATQGYRAGAGLYGASNGFDYRLALSRSEHGDRRARNGTLDNSDYDTESLATHLGYAWDNQYLAFKAERFNLSANSWVEPKPGEELDLAFPKRDQTRYAVFYEANNLTPWLRKLSADAYWRKVDRLFENQARISGPPRVSLDNQSDDRQLTRGLALRGEMELFNGQTTLAGLEYMQDSLDSDKDTLTITRPPVGPTIISARQSSQKASQDTLSAFVQQRWDFSEAVTGYLGGRYYAVDSQIDRSSERQRSSDTDERVLGSAGLLWSMAPEWTARAGFSQGYSFPSLTHQYSVTAGGSDIHYGNPDLKPERARTMELGLRHDSRRLTLDAVVFATKASDYIDRSRLAGTPAEYQPQGTARSRHWQWVNVDEARTRGLEVAVQWRPELPVTPHAAFNLNRRTLHFGDGQSTADSGMTQASGTFGLKHFSQPGNGISSELDLYLRAVDGVARKGKDISGALVQTDRASGFATLNLAWNLDFGDRASTRVLLGNLLNRDYRAIDEVPGMKRHLDVEFTVEF